MQSFTCVIFTSTHYRDGCDVRTPLACFLFRYYFIGIRVVSYYVVTMNR